MLFEAPLLPVEKEVPISQRDSVVEATGTNLRKALEKLAQAYKLTDEEMERRINVLLRAV